MVVFRSHPLVLIVVFCFLLEASCVLGRVHRHSKHRGPESGLYGSISQPPGLPPSEPPSPGGAGNSSSDSGVFDVRSFGAVGDCTTDDTSAFRAAWEAACKTEYGVLLVPSGYTFTITSTIFTGPCRIGFTFQVDGVLMPPDGPDCWPKTDSPRQWLVFYRADGMTLQGEGVIEGNGQKWWDMPCKPHRGPNGSTSHGPCDSPTAVRFFESSNLTVRQIKVQNSPQFHIKFDSCDNVLIDSVFIVSPALSPNTDGIHVQNTRNVGIYNSHISNGDDCISIGPGCADVDIENVTCGPSHGISIGSLGFQNTLACVSNVSVSNSVIRNSDNGVRIKTWQGGMGTACRNQTSAVQVADVAYRNIKGTYDVRSPPIHFACSDTMPCANITLGEVELLPAEGEMVADPFCWNTYGGLETVTIPPILCLQEGAPLSLTEGSSYGC